MKNILFSTIIMISFTLPSMCQNFSVGTYAAYNYTGLRNSNIDGGYGEGSSLEKQPSGSAAFGIDGIIYFSKYLGLSAGVIHTSQNNNYEAKYYNNIVTVTDKIENRMSYLDVPVLFRFKIKAFYLEAGPQIGFLMNAEEKYAGMTARDVTNSFQSVNGMFDLGAGFSWKVSGRFSMTAGLRLGIGFTDITKEYASEASIPEDASIITRYAHATYYYYDIIDALLGQATAYTEFEYKKTYRNFAGANLTLRYNLSQSNK